MSASEPTSERPDAVSPYCCPQHALCNVDLPGGDGEYARRQFAALSATAADSWCGETRGAHGAIVVSDDMGRVELFVALGGRVQWVKP